MRIAHSILILAPSLPGFASGAREIQAPEPTSALQTRTAPPVALLSAVPDSAQFAVAVHDSSGLLRHLRTNAWSRLLHDERLWGPDEGPEALAAKLLHLMGPLGRDGAEVLHAVVMASDALVFVAEFDAEGGSAAPDSEAGSDAGIGLALVARPGSDVDAFDAAWESLLELGDEPPASEQAAASPPAAGDRFVVGGWSAFSERTVGGDALIVLARTTDSLEPLAAAVSAGLAERRTAPDWVHDARLSAPGGVQFELIARPAGIPWSHLGIGELEAVLHRAVGVDRIRWAYAGGRIGADEEFDLNLALHVPADTTVSAFLAALRSVDPALYRIVPADAISASFTSVDVRIVWNLVTTLLAEHFPEKVAGLESSIAEIEAQLGIDPLEDLLFLFSGDSIEWTTVAPTEKLRPGSSRGVQAHESVIATLSDSEQFEESLAALLDAVGISFALSVHDYGDHEVTSLGLEAGRGGAIWAFPSGALVFSTEKEAVHAALDRWEGRGEEGATSLLDHPVLGPRVRSVEGAFHVAAFDTAAVLRDVLKALETFNELLEGGLTLGFELGSFTLPFPGLVDEYFQGSVLVFAQHEPERVVLRVSGR